MAGYGPAARARGAAQRAAAAGADDALVVVWGPARRHATAAEEIRLRFVDARRRRAQRDAPAASPTAPPTSSASCPAPTACTRTPTARRRRHARARRAPAGGPARARPGSARPATGRPACRVADLPLPDPPRRRSARRSRRRRGGADLRFAAFFFGERLKGLRRAGLPVDAIEPRALVRAVRRPSAGGPSLREAWRAAGARAWRAGRRGRSRGAAPRSASRTTHRGLARAAPAAGSSAPSARPSTATRGRVLRHATGRAMPRSARPTCPARAVRAGSCAAALEALT